MSTKRILPARLLTPSNEAGALVRVLLGAACISFSPVLVRLAEAEPTAATFYRMFFGALALAPFLLFSAKGRGSVLAVTRLGPKVPLLLAACIGFFYLDLEFWHRSIGYVGPGLSTILANFQVFFMALYGALMLGERLSPLFPVAAALALTGLWMLLGAPLGLDSLGPHVAEAGSAGGAGVLTGVGLGLATALAYTGYLVCLRRSQRVASRAAGPSKVLDPVANMFLISVGLAVLVFGAAWLSGTSLVLTNTRATLCFLAYGIGPQALGWLLLSISIPRLPAAVAGLLMLLQPGLAFTWDILFFDRPTGPLELIGATLALAAIYMGMRVSGRRARS